MATPLNKALGARPSNLSGPVPGADAADSAAADIKPIDAGKMSAPADSAGGEAPPAEAPVSEFDVDHPSMQAAASGAPKQTSEFDVDNVGLSPHQQVQAAGAAARDPNFVYAGDHVRFSKNSGIQYQGDSGKWGPADVAVTRAFGSWFKESGFQTAGSVLAMAAASPAAIAAGPAAPVVEIGAGAAGAAAGQAVANQVFGAPSATEGIGEAAMFGAAGAALPIGLSKWLGASARQWAGKAAASEAAAVGSQALMDRAKLRQSDFAAAGITPRSDHLFLESPESAEMVKRAYLRGGKEAQMLIDHQAGAQEKIATAQKTIQDNIAGPYNFEDLVGQARDFNGLKNTLFEKSQSGLGSQVAELNKLSGKQIFNDKVGELNGKMRDTINKHMNGDFFHPDGSLSAAAIENQISKNGPIPPESKELLVEYARLNNKLKEFGAKNEAGSKVGYSLNEVDNLRKKYQERGEFNPMKTDPSLSAWNQFSHDARMTLMDSQSEAAASAGKPELAQNIKTSKAQYSSGIDHVNSYQKLIQSDPENAAYALISWKNAGEIKSTMALLDDQSQRALRASALDSLAIGEIDKATGKMNVSAAARKWDKIPEDVKVATFGEVDANKLNSLVNVSKVLNARPLSGYTAQEHSLVDKMVGMIAHPGSMPNKAITFIKGLFPNNPQIADIMVTKALGQTPPNIYDYATSRAASYKMMSEATSPGTAFAPLVGGASAGSLRSMKAPQYPGDMKSSAVQE